MTSAPRTEATVQQHMTASPYTIGFDQTMREAHAILFGHRIRHLPVVQGERLVGMLTERDFALLSGLTDLDLSSMTVGDAMSVGVYKVRPEASLKHVARELASLRIDAAIVVEHEKVLGILTTVDLCAALAQVLDQHA